MKIVIMESLGISDDNLNLLLENLRKNHEIVIYDKKTTNEDELIERARGAEAIVIANNPLPGSVISKLPELKFISVAFVGIDHVDIEACKKQNIRISNAAGYANHAVAELAIGLTLSVLRNIPQTDKRTRSLLTKDGLIGSELYKKTFGIIGTGAIGLQTARLASAFGCKIIAYSRTQKFNLNGLDLTYVSLENLLKTADIVSIHTPLTPETKHLLDAEKLDLMRPSSILINTARGPIVDNAYLSTILSKGQISGAGIDVFDIEPPLLKEEALIQNENTVLTPHIAFATKESILRRADIVIQNIDAYLNDELQNIML